MRASLALLLAASAATVAGGCAPALRRGARPGGPFAPEEASASAAEVHALARRIEGEPSAARRGDLSVAAVAAGQRCQQAAPDTAACDYALAIALGIQAREHPSTVRDGLAKMAALLRRAAAVEPRLDQAGPDRVLALLLLRAPSWPLGPGDPGEGLAAARRAVALVPDHAPNLLALAEALLANDEPSAGREAARRALTQAEAAEAAGEPDAAGWRRAAGELLARGQ